MVSSIANQASFPACREDPLYLTLCLTIPTNHFHPPLLFWPFKILSNYLIQSSPNIFVFVSSSPPPLPSSIAPLSLLLHYSFSALSFWGSGFVVGFSSFRQHFGISPHAFPLSIASTRFPLLPFLGYGGTPKSGSIRFLILNSYMNFQMGMCWNLLGGGWTWSSLWSFSLQSIGNGVREFVEWSFI